MKKTTDFLLLLGFFVLAVWTFECLSDRDSGVIWCDTHEAIETQRHECAVKCENCKTADRCCCRTTDSCTCIDPTTNQRCCDGE
jgi:hypothetical protein